MEGTLTMDDLCKMFGRSPQTIRRWIREGHFPRGKKIGSLTYWRAEIIAKFINAGQATAKELAIMGRF